MKVIGLAALLLLLSVSAIAQSSSHPTDLTLKDIHGRTFRLSDYKGRVVLVNFWATWCIPCRTEIPDLIKLQRRYRHQGLRIIGITSPPETLSEVRIFVRKLRINYPIAIGTKQTKTRFTASETLPMTVVIDSQGTIRTVIEGIMYADEVEETVKPLLLSNRDSNPEPRAYQACSSIGIRRTPVQRRDKAFTPNKDRQGDKN